MSKSMRDEMEAAITTAADNLHDATQWWDTYYANDDGKRPIDRLLDRLGEIATAWRDTKNDGEG